jgi:hypothetical protein
MARAFDKSLAMAVRALPRSSVRPTTRAGALPALVLFLALLPLAADLLVTVEPALSPVRTGLVLATPAACALVVSWLRFPHTSWLAAASVAALASVALRSVAIDVAPMLSLLSIVALGIGGAFATYEHSLLPDA